MEAELTKGLSSRFVCDWLYFYMWMLLVAAGIYVAMGLGSAYVLKGNFMMKLLVVLPSLVAATFLALTGMSLYILCERGLKPTEKSVLH
jgi:hypothetical protein